MKKLKCIRDCLLECVESQMGDLKNVDAGELGEVVDMVKDMEEAMYYHVVRETMEDKAEEEEEYEKYHKFYQKQLAQHAPIPMQLYQPQEEKIYRDLDRDFGKMYYGGRMDGSSYVREGNVHNPKGSYEMDMDINRMDSKNIYPAEIRDPREGRSPMSRKNYMESKEMHQGVPAQVKELEKYMKELSEDLTEMIEDASPEEKQILQQKLSSLAAKIK